VTAAAAAALSFPFGEVSRARSLRSAMSEVRSLIARF
jgi:hypothetical protein